MDEVIAEVQTNGVTQAELDRARNAAIADIIYNSDNQTTMARTYGWALATGRTIEDVEARAERLRGVTVEDVKAVAVKYLTPKRSVTGLLVPVAAQTATVNGIPPVAPGGVIN